ncbi:MAG TPA: hypothetical protein VK843_13240 [Planctomycetota bacterium]|nr:hypothetical protein [Planctomycetota bacterium]
MKSARWVALALLLLAGAVVLFFRGPDLTPPRIEAPLQEKRSAIQAEEAVADARRPIDNPTFSNAPTTAVPSSSIAARVIDPSGAVVAGAEVWFCDGLIDEVQGVSDAEGMVHCARAHWKRLVSERAFLTAYFDGCAPGIADLPVEPVLQPIDITLRPAWTVNGRVIGPLGSDVGAGFSVAAIRSDCAPRVESLKAGKRGISWICAAADPQGRFVLDGLDRDRSYELVAWGPGFLPDGRRKTVSFASGADEQLTKVTPLYGCLFKFSDARNGKVRTSALLTFEAGLGFKNPRGFTSIGPDYPYVRLAQVPEGLLISRGPSAMAVLVTPETEREVVDSISGVGASLKLPGYEPCQFEAEAPLARGECAEHDVTLFPSASGFGSLKIHFTNFPAITETDLQTFSSSRLFGVVMLGNTTGSPYSIAVRLDCGGEVSLDGVPAGRYRVWFRDTFALFSSQVVGQEPVHEVIADSETELALEVPPHGQLVFYTNDGVGPRQPPLGFQLAHLRGEKFVPARGTAYFPHLPSALFFLPVGRYQIKSLSALFGPDRLGELQVDIASGQRLTLAVCRPGS